MLVAAAACPCPPLLVPEVAAGAAPELDAARAACTDALGVLAASVPTCWSSWARTTAPGRTPTWRAPRAPSAASASTWTYGWGRATGTATARSSLRAGRGRLAAAADRVGRRPRRGAGRGEVLAPDECLAEGRRLAARADRVALLVMGDASACRTLKAPGYLDERAAPYDAEVARALGSADTAALRALDPGLAHDLKVSGRAPWQVLAGAAEVGAGLSGALLHEDAPYGVGYIVATWS